jgi:transcriptional regulator with XRE-family HTH domain
VAGTLHERLKLVTAKRSIRSVADATHQHPETVRRYLAGQTPSPEFIVGVCAAYGINADWLLTGRGAMRVADIRQHALREAKDEDLLSALATTIDRLHERVERVEGALRGMQGAGAVAAPAPPPPPPAPPEPPPPPTPVRRARKPARP